MLRSLDLGLNAQEGAGHGAIWQPQAGGGCCPVLGSQKPIRAPGVTAFRSSQLTEATRVPGMLIKDHLPTSGTGARDAQQTGAAGLTQSACCEELCFHQRAGTIPAPPPPAPPLTCHCLPLNMPPVPPPTSVASCPPHWRHPTVLEMLSSHRAALRRDLFEGRDRVCHCCIPGYCSF